MFLLLIMNVLDLLLPGFFILHFMIHFQALDTRA